jgi:hypothetical protein
MPLAAQGSDFQCRRAVHRIESEFVFALCNPGSEKALKREVEAASIGWRLSYQRRGFVTFKADAPLIIEYVETYVVLSLSCFLYVV